MSEENREKIEDELSKIKEEMQELKEILKQKREHAEDNEDYEEYDEDDNKRRSRKFTFNIGSDFDHDDFGFNADDIDFTLNNYLGSVMHGLSDNIKRSVERATEGLDRLEINLGEKARRQAEKEINRSKRDIKRSVRHANKRARKARKHFGPLDMKTRTIHMEKLTEEELEKFYESGSNLVGALSDQRRLKLLKLLEDGPAYQGDLSDKTGVKGGTFKHHMDLLMSSKYVFQEATRGRYLITRFGVEALKLTEMLFRRYEFENKSPMKEQKDQEETDGDQSDQVEILEKGSEVKGIDFDEEIDDTMEDPETVENLEKEDDL